MTADERRGRFQDIRCVRATDIFDLRAISRHGLDLGVDPGQRNSPPDILGEDLPHARDLVAEISVDHSVRANLEPWLLGGAPRGPIRNRGAHPPEIRRQGQDAPILPKALLVDLLPLAAISREGGAATEAA